MNSSDQPGPGNDGIHSWIDPDLEARIVAAVVGEASDFEMAELDRLMEEKPELAVFKRRIEAVHGLVGESFAVPDAKTNDDEWRIDPEKRDHLLNKLGLSSEKNSTDEAAPADEVPGSFGNWKVWMTTLSSAAAALVAIAAFLYTQLDSSAPVTASFATNDLRYSASESEPESFAFAEVRKAGKAAPESTVNYLGYQASLARLSEETSLGDTENLITRFGRQPTQAGGNRLNVEQQKLTINSNVKTADASIRSELALVPQQATAPTAANMPDSVPEDGLVSESIALGVPDAPPLPTITSAVEVAETQFGDHWDFAAIETQQTIADTSHSTSTRERKPVEELDQLSDLDVASNDKDGDDIGISAGRGLNEAADAEDYFFEESDTEPASQNPGSSSIQASPKIVVRSGEAAEIEVTRELIYPTEFGSNQPELQTDAPEEVLWDTPRVETTEDRDYASSQPTTAEYQRYPGPVDSSYELSELLESARVATGGTNVQGLDRQEDRFSIAADYSPEIIEFEGFVNYGNEVDATQEADRKKSERVFFAGGTSEDLDPESASSSNWTFTPPSKTTDSVSGGNVPLISELLSGNEAITSDQIDGLIAHQRSNPTESDAPTSGAAAASKDGVGADWATADEGGMGRGTETLWASQPGAIQLGEQVSNSENASSIFNLYGESAVTAPATSEEARTLGRTLGEQPPPGVSGVAGVFTDPQFQEVMQKKAELHDRQQALVDLEDGAVVKELNKRISMKYGSRRADSNITLREKNTGTINFGAGFSSIDNLKGFIDITQSNSEITGQLESNADEFSVAEVPSGDLPESARSRGLEALVENQDQSRSYFRSGLTDDFDNGVGNAPDVSLSLESEGELKQERLLEDSIAPSADGSVELARTKAGNGEYDDAREILTRKLADDPGNDQARLLMSHLDDPDRYPAALTPEHMKNVKEVEHLLKLSQGYQELGQHDKAKQQLDAVLELDQHNTAARRLIAENDKAVSDDLQTTLESKLSVGLQQIDEPEGAPESDASLPLAKTDSTSDDASSRLHSLDEPAPSTTAPVKDRITEAASRFEAAKSEFNKARLGPFPNEVFRENRDLSEPETRSPEQIELEGLQQLASVSEKFKDFQEARKDLWKESGKEFAPVTTTEELASENAFSTFSLNVSDVAFKLAQSALAKGEWPEPDKMRVEEFVNALDYGDPSPAPGEKVTCKTEQCAHPFMQQRNLLRIAMQTAAVGRGGGQPLRLTILLDHSGSMQREDREASVQRAMQLLTEQLQPSDQVSLIGFARTPRLLADRISGGDGDKLNAAVAAAPSEGGTNLEEALRLAAEVAQRQFDESAVNRIVLMTDGAANLGNANPEELATRVVELRQKGIAFDACGVGAKGLNDEVLEALTRKGDGRYYFLDAPEQADSGFASQLAGALRPAAKNVKVQVVFNPERVGAYRLIGYEKHRLKKEDFRNDAVDAAEMAAEEAGIAMYQFEPKADGTGEVGEVLVRFQDVASGQMIEHKWIIPFEKNAPSISEASPSIQLAATAAMLGEYLRGGPDASNVELDTLNSFTPNLRNSFGASVRVHQLIDMIRNAQMAK